MADPTPFEPDPTYDNSPHQTHTTEDIVEIINTELHTLNGSVSISGKLPILNSTRSNAEFKQLLRKRRNWL